MHSKVKAMATRVAIRNMASSLLLDTQAFLWWRINSPRLGVKGRESIANADLVFVSVASAWEAAIKVALGKLTLPEPFAAGVHDSGFEPLLVEFEHTEEVSRLPPHHRDPFDRMLIAQARTERIILVSSDPLFHRYEVDLIRL